MKTRERELASRRALRSGSPAAGSAVSDEVWASPRKDPRHSRRALTHLRAERPDIPDHPAYLQILTALADAGRPMRARDLCQALDLPILPKNTEGIRSKLKRLVSRGILTEAEPGLFTRPGA
ncbi:hypothetical protein SHIRM173S_09290 [Streptomyces hirsutus]